MNFQTHFRIRLVITLIGSESSNAGLGSRAGLLRPRMWVRIPFGAWMFVDFDRVTLISSRQTGI